MGDMAKDGRFSHIASDPRFKTIPRAQRQVKIDKRFQAMFKDDRFKMKYTVDKRGRPISRTSKEDLERFYALSSSDSESGEDEEEDSEEPSKPSKSLKDNNVVKSKTSELKSSGDTSSDDSAEEDNETAGSDNGELTDKVKSKLHDMSVDYARGEGALMSDSSSDESSDEEKDEHVEHGWGELDKDADRTEEITNRLAVCNMDWDRIRAIDLMVLLNSFIPPGGLIRSVTIYPSEFGLKRMKKEEEEGPTELVENGSKNKDKFIDKKEKEAESDDEDDNVDSGSGYEDPADENEEGSTYHREKLRQYQLNRLKYFYAVVECDSPNTANHIYSECDGMEYESSATRLDLRFVPDDTSFDQDPKETCSKMPDAVKYRPRSFTTTALQQAKVELTWDETDPTRSEISNRLMSGADVDENDLRTYLASSSEEEEDTAEKKKAPLKGKSNGIKNVKKGKGKSKDMQCSEDEANDGDDPIAKYRALLSGIEEEESEKKNKGVHMEISWGLGLQEKTEEVMKKKLSQSKQLTPFQEMMEKRKQKRQEKKKLKQDQKSQMQKTGDSDDENLISDDDIPSDVDMNDPYFAEEFKDVKKNSKKKKGKKHEKDSENEEEQNKKAELELLLFDKDDQKHFNFKKIQEEESINQSKRKKKVKRKMEKKGILENAQDDFKVDVDDNRFSALYSSHHYNIDPTDSHFRKSHGMEALISAKQKRLANSTPQIVDGNQSAPPPKKSKKDAELSLLVKSVKNKAQKLNKR